MKIVCASSLTLGREIFSAMGDVVRGPERYRAAHPGLRTGFFHAPSTRPMGAGRDLFGRRKDGAEVPIEVGLNPVQTEEGIQCVAGCKGGK